MRKFFTVCLWLGLVVCVFALIGATGTSNTLRAESRAAQRRYEALQKLYDQAKEDLAAVREALSDEEAGWRTDRDALEGRIDALTRELTDAQDRLTAQTAAADRELRETEEKWETEMEAWNRERAELTQSLDAAQGRISEVTALLLPGDEEPVPEEEEETEETEEADLFAVEP